MFSATATETHTSRWFRLATAKRRCSRHSGGVRPMQILSTPHSTFVTRVLPFMLVAGVCGWVYWPKRDEGMESLVIALFVFVIVNLLMCRELRKRLWRKADIVEDRGDRLVITRWKTTVEIPLSQVQEIMRVPMLGSMEVIIILKTPCEFGSEIAFYPPHKRKVPEIDHALDGLSRRVASQESKHVA
jgi:hypothetical protein